MKFRTVKDIREFIASNPNHPISEPWADMILDMDEFGEEYCLQDFIKEAEEQACEGNLSPYDLEQLFGR